MRTAVSVIVLALAAAGLLGWAGWSYAQSHTGPTVQATVDDCITSSGKGRRTRCTGHWEHNGERRTGAVANVDESDEGTAVTAHVHGDTAYAEALFAPLLRGGVGLLLLGGALAYRVMTRQRPPATAALHRRHPDERSG